VLLLGPGDERLGRREVRWIFHDSEAIREPSTGEGYAYGNRHGPELPGP
jgi:hypothetical protein